MKWNRIEAVVLRHLYHFRRNIDRLTDAIYWPLMDMLVWGLTAKWVQTSGSQIPWLLLATLTAIVFWQIVWRANYEVGVNLLEESWSRNLVNLFSTPLTVGEWISAVMLLGLIKVLLAVLIGLGGAWLLYSLNILKVGYLLIPFLTSLMLFGFAIGFIAAGLIARFGRQIQTLAWTMGFLFAPLSAVYYPVSALPGWAQYLSALLPTTYVFEGMRAVLMGGEARWNYLCISLCLNFVYLGGSILFFMHMFERRRINGLEGLE